MGRKAIPVFYPRILSRRLGWLRGGRLVSNCVVIGYLSMDSRVTLGWALTLEYEPSVVLVRGLVHVRVKVGPPEALRYRGRLNHPAVSTKSKLKFTEQCSATHVSGG